MLEIVSEEDQAFEIVLPPDCFEFWGLAAVHDSSAICCLEGAFFFDCRRHTFVFFKARDRAAAFLVA